MIIVFSYKKIQYVFNSDSYLNIIKNFNLSGDILIKEILFLDLNGFYFVGNPYISGLKLLITSFLFKTKKKFSLIFKKRKRFSRLIGFKESYYSIFLKKLFY